MNRFALAGVSLIALTAPNAATAGDLGLATPAQAAPYGWGYVAPYPKDWDSRIGYDFWTRFINYYALEMGHAEPPPDPDCTAWTPQGLDAGAADHPALSVHGMAVWRFDLHWRDAAQFRGQPADGGDVQHRRRQGAERGPHPDLRVGQFRRQLQHQHGEAGRQLAGRLHVYAEYRGARSSRHLHRAAARYGAEGSRRLGLPILRDVRRELPLHHRLWSRELPAAQPQPGQRLRLPDGVRRDLHSVRG